MRGRNSAYGSAARMLAGVVLAFTLASCGGQRSMSQNTDSTTATPPQAMMPGGSLDDGQIAAIAMAINSSEVDAGQAAQPKATNPQVKEFASMMVNDHGASRDRLNQMMGGAGLTSEQSDLSTRMKAENDSVSAALASLSGAAFDAAYMEHMVQGHQEALDLLDQQLIPNAQNAELKQYLNDMRPAVAAHLERAKSIQGTVGNKM